METLKRIKNNDSSIGKSITESKTISGYLAHPTSIANEFNNYFVETGSELASKIPTVHVKPTDTVDLN